jgi:hypothetical protein
VCCIALGPCEYLEHVLYGILCGNRRISVTTGTFNIKRGCKNRCYFVDIYLNNIFTMNTNTITLNLNPKPCDA